MAMKRKHSDDSPRDSPSEPTIYRSAPIEDRDSTFIGLYSPDLGPKELQKLQELKSASHRMLAWRRESNQQSLTTSKQYVTGNDDDGEKYGGRKVENVLIRMKATGSCVVARWYGGTMLGQARFVHIENCANEAVRQWLDHVGEQQAKKRRIEDETVEKEKLAKALAARDQSIIVLRTLATEKEKLAKEAVEKKTDDTRDLNDKAIIVDATRNKTPSPPRGNPGVQPPGPDYDAMSVERLRALDKARDATLAFLLKRIDKAESALAKIAREKASEEKEQHDKKPVEVIQTAEDLRGENDT
jgi:putative IMPACT (imprinted ancient) family translation regulator